jgi:hypothetical protein
VTKIWDKGPHNAFTDLIRWQNKWYCTFREAEGHVGGDGKLRVLESVDGKNWEPLGLIEEAGIDLRDPKLSVTPGDRLMIVAGGSMYRGKTFLGMQPRVTFSKDGRQWTPPQRVLAEGEWLWRITWHQKRAYGVSYSEGPPPKEGKERTSEVKLFVSDDGVKYDLVTRLDVPGQPNETTLRFLPGGELVALVRRDGSNGSAYVGTSREPFREWKWVETKQRIGGPNFIRLPDGSLWAAGRKYPDGPKTALGRLTRDSYDPVLTLPSGGDTSYPGLVWHDGLLWVSYYSSHEGKSSIYLATVKVPQGPIDIGLRLELFVDHHLIDGLGGEAQLKLHRPTPAEVVLTADKPWEGNTSAYYTLFQDDELYRMYYRGAHWDDKANRATHREVTCYAESKDGVNWTKPKLGLFDFEGSKDNNIVWDSPGTHNFTPFKDTNPKAAADARYKALALGKGGLLAFKSADGLRWSLLANKPVITRGAFDSQNLAFWDPHIGKYREYHRWFRGVREIMTGTSDDFLTWTDPVLLDYPGAPVEHLYTNAIRPYERAPHLLIGFPTRFLPPKEQTEPVFMSSRDGRTFHRSSEAVIPPTAPKDRDGNRSNYMTWGLLQLPGHDNELSVYATEAYYKGPAGRVRRFHYRLDGFMSVHAGGKGGEVASKLLRFQGKRLVLNYVTAPRGSIRVELLNAEGKPLEKYTLADCAELRGDSTAGTVAWKASNDVGRLAGQPVRLRFELKDADLYSFQFRE